MHTLTRTLAALILGLTVLAGGTAHAAPAPAKCTEIPKELTLDGQPGAEDYSNLTREQLIACLTVRDASIATQARSVDAYGQRVAALEDELAAASRDLTRATYLVSYYTDLARTWENYYRDTHAQLVRAHRRIARLEQRLEAHR